MEPRAPYLTAHQAATLARLLDLLTAEQVCRLAELLEQVGEYGEVTIRKRGREVYLRITREERLGLAPIHNSPIEL